jgi:hypothetical protein
MRVRFYSPPFFAGVPNGGCTMWVSYVFAENGGGGDVMARLVEYSPPDGEPIPDNAIRAPSPDEMFGVEGVDRDHLQSGDRIQLRTSDGHYVGILHDEEDRADYVVASASQPGIGETFEVEFLDNLAVSSIDPCGPSYTIALVGHNSNYLSFPWSGAGPLEICCPVIGQTQKILFDYLSGPSACERLGVLVKRLLRLPRR